MVTFKHHKWETNSILKQNTFCQDPNRGQDKRSLTLLRGDEGGEGQCPVDPDVIDALAPHLQFVPAEVQGAEGAIPMPHVEGVDEANGLREQQLFLIALAILIPILIRNFIIILWPRGSDDFATGSDAPYAVLRKKSQRGRLRWRHYKLRGISRLCIWVREVSVALTIDGPAPTSLGLRIAGDAGALVGARRVAAHLVAGARLGALVVVHAAGGVRRLGHLVLGAVAACPLRGQLAVIAAVQRGAGSVLFIC